MAGVSQPFRFMDLPDELRLNCLEQLFPRWSWVISKMMTAGQAIYIVQHLPGQLDLLLVSKNFGPIVKDCIITRFDKSLELGAGTLMYFVKVRQQGRLTWLTDRIECLSLHMTTSIPRFDYHFKFPALQTINLLVHYRSSNWPATLRSMEDVLINRSMDAEVIQDAIKKMQKIRQGHTPLRLLLKQQSIRFHGTWECETYLGHWPMKTSPHHVDLCLDLEVSPPRIVERKAVIKDAFFLGNWQRPSIRNILQLVW